jgi:hypothetical protein
VANTFGVRQSIDRRTLPDRQGINFASFKAGLESGSTLQEAYYSALKFAFRPENPLGFKDELVQVSGIGMGFVLTRRACFDRIIPGATPLTYSLRDFPGELVYAFFREILQPNGYFLSEDLSFCQRLIDSEGEVFACPELSVGHLGTFVHETTITSWSRCACSEMAAFNPDLRPAWRQE